MDSDSTENQAPGDGVKEILAPAEGPRENLIATAIKFLQNPKVMSSPLYQKKAFLEKKGLTQVEIDLAVQRSGVVESATPGAGNSAAPPGQAAQIGPPQVYQPGVAQPHYVPIPPQSGWARARDLTMTTVVVASVSYAVYQVFQKYLRPWLLGKSEQERRLERLEQEIKAVAAMQDSLRQISDTLASIQASLVEQQHQNATNHGELQGISDLKSDISSLKGLMLNKNQFPAAPTTAPVLPSWQRAPVAAATNSTSSSTSAPPSSSSKSLSSSPAAAPSSSPAQNGTTSEQVNGLLESEQGEEIKEAKSKSVQEIGNSQNQESADLAATQHKEADVLSAGDAEANENDNPKMTHAENGSAEATLSSES